MKKWLRNKLEEFEKKKFSTIFKRVFYFFTTSINFGRAKLSGNADNRSVSVLD